MSFGDSPKLDSQGGGKSQNEFGGFPKTGFSGAFVKQTACIPMVADEMNDQDSSGHSYFLAACIPVGADEMIDQDSSGHSQFLAICIPMGADEMIDH